MGQHATGTPDVQCRPLFRDGRRAPAADRRDRVLDAAKRFADHIDGIFGPGKRYDVGGHEEIELALIKLYRATGERRYLELCRFFLDERGHAHGTEREAVRSAAPSRPSFRRFEDLPDRRAKPGSSARSATACATAGCRTTSRWSSKTRRSAMRCGPDTSIRPWPTSPDSWTPRIRAGGRADLAGRGVPQDVCHGRPRHRPVP